MVAAVEKAGVPNMVWYNYRRIPAVTLAKKLIDEGRLGKIFHYRAKFLQDWTIKADLPQGGQGLWRLDVAAAGSGVSGDLLAHCIDTAIWLNGRIDSVCAMTETFVKERMHNLTGKVEKVGIDDACIFMGRFANGSLANFESTRYARGHKALYTFEINGENMSLVWDLHDLHRLQVFDYKDEGKIRGWKSVHVTDNSPDHPYMDELVGAGPRRSATTRASRTRSRTSFRGSKPASREGRPSGTRSKRNAFWTPSSIPRGSASGSKSRRAKPLRTVAAKRKMWR